jgi:hypothetical protein
VSSTCSTVSTINPPGRREEIRKLAGIVLIPLGKKSAMPSVNFIEIASAPFLHADQESRFDAD